MKTAICNIEQLQDKEAWEAKECNFVEHPFCNCKDCIYMMGFKMTKLINGECVVLVDCNYQEPDNLFLEAKIKYYLEMSSKAIENGDLEDSIEYAKKLCNVKKLLAKLNQE